jgi:nucleoside-diphosphate-sugar epimerase
MRVVVFGAAGFTGRAVLSNLAGKHHVRAFERSPESWAAWCDTDGEWQDGEKVYGDMADFASVHRATEGMDAIIHLAVYQSSAPGAYSVDDPQPFLVNLKGLWNVLESARQRGIQHIVHMGSCQTVHPQGVFFTSEVRRPDASLYAVCKRLQEEMCRQFYEGYGLHIVVLRPDYIVDSRLGIGRHREKLGSGGSPRRNGWVCRHDLAEACRLAVEAQGITFDVLHIVGTPEADNTCNAARARQVLGLVYQGDLEQYR